MLSSPDSPLGKLLSQYVLVRIIRLDDVDLGLFDWDRHNTIYFFALNAEEQIYLRYGGRDETAVESHLNLESLEQALRIGLELHEKYKAGDLEPKPRPEPVFARDFPLLVERTIGSGACVECHLVADFRNQHRELEGTLDIAQHLYRSPDIRTIGVDLDIPEGLLVEGVSSAVEAAGMQAGDRITHVNGQRVYTFGDFQYYYDKVDRDAERVTLTVDRNGEPVELNVQLPERWWLTDLDFRHWSMEPLVYFATDPLSGEEKGELGLPAGSFAGRVRTVEGIAETLGYHSLQKGDIITAVDGVQVDDQANTPELYLKLRTTAGSTVTLDVIRDGERIAVPLRSARLSFRK